MNNEIDQRDKIGICFLLVIVMGGAIGAFALIYKNSLTIVPMDTTELVVTQMEFTTFSDSDVIILHVTYPDTLPVTVVAIKINGETQNKITVDSIHGLTFEPGDSGTITIEYDWTTGDSYTVNGFTSDGTMVMAYTDTA